MVLELQTKTIWQIMFSTHHTDVGLLYLITSLAFMFSGGALALLLRVELFSPGVQIIADSMTYNRIFASSRYYSNFLIHFAICICIWKLSCSNYGPIQRHGISKIKCSSILDDSTSRCTHLIRFADFTWYAYPTYSVVSAPGPAADMWIFGLKILGVSSIFAQFRSYNYEM